MRLRHACSFIRKNISFTSDSRGFPGDTASARAADALISSRLIASLSANKSAHIFREGAGDAGVQFYRFAGHGLDIGSTARYCESERPRVGGLAGGIS